MFGGMYINNSFCKISTYKKLDPFHLLSKHTDQRLHTYIVITNSFFWRNEERISKVN